MMCVSSSLKAPSAITVYNFGGAEMIENKIVRFVPSNYDPIGRLGLLLKRAY